MGKTMSKTVDLQKVRQAIANYMRSEGCGCCRGHDHDSHAKVLAELLDVPLYDDESGYDFYQFCSGRDGVSEDAGKTP